ncbi:MAG: phosphatase PAP2 family protein [Chloroflexi bacterium]|nr:phosphatase PAP2 family protein [Chloroflexota bacterium]
MTVEAARIRYHATRAWRFSHRVGIHEAVLVVIAFLVYFLIRGMVVNHASTAYANADDVIALERRLGIYRELAMQGWILPHYSLIKVMNWIYFWGHMPVVIVFAIWLFVFHRRTYSRMRNAFLASGAIAVVIYALYPVAPPRLLAGTGIVDTMALYDRVGYNAQEVRAFVNPYAAVPSLHFGWSLLLGLAIAVVARQWILRVFGVLWPVAMFFAIVLTGNHFVLDAVAGAIVSFAGFGIGFFIDRAWRARFGDESEAVEAPPEAA